MLHIITLVAQIAIAWFMIKIFNSNKRSFFDILNDIEWVKTQCKDSNDWIHVRRTSIRMYVTEFYGLAVMLFVGAHGLVAIGYPTFALFAWTIAMFLLGLYHSIAIKSMNSDYNSFKEKQSC